VFEWWDNNLYWVTIGICKNRVLIAKLFLFRTDKQIKKYLNLPVLSLFQIAVTVRK